MRIENLLFGEFITCNDRAETLFYLDPPYHGVENYYGKGLFSREDFARLAGQLASIEGSFILSLNDTPEVRDTFKAFRLDPVTTKYTCSKSAAKPASELLISNL